MLRPMLPICCALVAAIWAIMRRRAASTTRLPSLLDATLDDLTLGLAQGHFTSAHLVQTYAARVAEVNHLFHAVIELNPDAEVIAQALDQERSEKGPRRCASVPSIVHHRDATG